VLCIGASISQLRNTPGGIPSPLKHFQLKEEEIEFREKKKKDGVAYC